MNIVSNDAKDIDTDFLIYSADFCPYCVAAERYLRSYGFSYTIVDLTHNLEKRRDIIIETGHRTVPVIFDLRNNRITFIGGFDNLQESGIV